MGGSLLNNNESLIKTLEKAATAVVPDGSPRTPLHPPAWVETDEGAAFLRKVGEADPLQLFDGTLQTIGNRASAVDRDQLAHWMVERARIVGARQTVEEVDRYIERDSFEACQVMLLSGLRVESEFDLGGGIRLVPAYEVPTQRLQATLGGSYWNGLPTPELSSVLICSFQHQKVHRPQADPIGERRPSHGFVLDTVQRTLEDAHLCLALVRPRGCGVQAIGSTTVAGDDVPILSGFGWSIHSYRTPRFEAPLITIEAQTAKSLHEKFLALDSPSQDHLRIPMQKLNECAASLNSVQAAVDLRTALEALFLDDNVKGEQRYRLGLRAAISRGGDITRRKETQQKAMKAYDLCSQAVHNGRLSLRRRTDDEILKCAEELVRDTLCRMIHAGRGKPDWKVVELTGETGLDEESP